MLVNYNGRAVDIQKVKYPEKIWWPSTREHGLDLYLYNGARITIDYGYNVSKRDEMYNKTIEAVNIVTMEGLQNYN